jgi:diaminopimelate epimerase
MTRAIPFTKVVGAGNDFIIIDTLHHRLGPLVRRWPAVSRQLCDRHHGIGADGLLVLEPSRVAHVKMRVFNADGSEAQMCGNGARCVARVVRAWGEHRGEVVRIESASGLLEARVRGETIQMRMPDPTRLRVDLPLRVGRRAYRTAYVHTGVPHVVVPVRGLDRLDVGRLGRSLRHHRSLGPAGANVDFIQRDRGRPNRLRVRTYERGVEGETLACGTGVAASAVIYAVGTCAAAKGRGSHAGPISRRCRVGVHTRSGEVMTVSFNLLLNGRQRRVTDLVLEGPARRIFEGTVMWPPLREN